MDTTNIKNNIFYRPDLTIEKDYHSSGEFTHSVETPSEEEIISIESPLEKMYTTAQENEAKFVQIRPALNVLPDSIKKVVTMVNDYLFIQEELELNEINNLLIEEVQDEEKETYITTDETDSEPTSSTDESTYIDEEGFVWGEMPENNVIVTVKKAKSSAEQAKEQYLQDSTDLKEEYLMQLNDAMSEYIYPLSTYMAEIGISDKTYLDQDYDGTAVTGISASAQHLHDTILRNDLSIDEISLLMNKLITPENMLNTFASLDAASQQRIRYYTEEYKDDIATFTDVKKNDLLLDNRDAYDDKYTQCKLNAYKFLTTAVEFTKEICKQDLDSKAAKCSLLGEGVNIYSTKKYDSISLSNGTSSNIASNDISASTTGITGTNAAVAATVTKNKSNTTTKTTNTTATDKTNSTNTTTEKQASSSTDTKTK